MAGAVDVFGNRRRRAKLGDFDLAELGLAWEVFPGESVRQQGFELTPEGEGIMAISEDKAIARSQCVPSLENQAMLVGTGRLAKIKDQGFGEFGSHIGFF